MIPGTEQTSRTGHTNRTASVTSDARSIWSRAISSANPATDITAMLAISPAWGRGARLDRDAKRAAPV